jgi:HAD superfamily hydrolase (TIGR01662 family)
MLNMRAPRIDTAFRDTPAASRLPRVRAVLFDRDGTLIVDRPGPRSASVEPMPGARDALSRLRELDVRVGVVSNQPAIADGTLDEDEMRATHRQIEMLLGEIDVWSVCPHARDAGCACRKPAPGLILDAARRLRVAPRECVVVGDIGSDVEAAQAAGARAVLVPTGVTRAEEIANAPVVARDLTQAVELIVWGAV